jgi:hypothetical protein
MDISRNQYFFMGILCLFLGGEVLLVDSFDVNPDFAQFLADRTSHPLASVSATTQTLVQSDRPLVKKTIRPPRWLGGFLLSVGSVLVLHSWGMKKSG